MALRRIDILKEMLTFITANPHTSSDLPASVASITILQNATLLFLNGSEKAKLCFLGTRNPYINIYNA
ncbi:MAG: hypothetical protein QM802_26450 [Agriterribacter sp.]